MENLLALVVVILIVIFHRAIGAVLGGAFVLGALGLVLVVLFLLVRYILFTPL
jgi:hypothetical protein